MAKRKIKITKATRFDYTIQSFQDEEISIVENPAFYREYDESGNMINEIVNGPGGYLSEKYSFVYRDKKMVEQLIYMDEDTVAEHQFFEYQNDKIIKQITKYQEGEDEIIWSYDDKGRILSKTTYDEGDETNKTTYEYQANTIHIKEYDSNELILNQVNSFDDKARIVEQKTINLIEEEKSITTFEYSDTGALLREVQTTLEGDLIQSIENKYNEKGQMIEVLTSTQDSITKLEIKFDEDGNEVYQLETNEKGEINHQVARSFDSEGNLLATEVELFYHGLGMDSHYEIKYEYEFFEEGI